MEKGLVNILTPAYNCADYIPKLLNSILNQSYPSIEMWIIDDGSTDNTAEVIRSYMPLFKKKGYNLHYVFQNNSGQSVAINNGLKFLNGEYLVWPDADDWYSGKNAISELVNCFESHKQSNLGIVRCIYQRLNEKDSSLEGYSKIPTTKIPVNMFYDALYNKVNFGMEPGGIMIRLDLLDEYIPNREIYCEKGAGQNFQLIYPYLYYSNCLQVDKVLYSYLIRNMSHSRGQFSGFEKEKERLDIYKRTIMATMRNIRIQVVELERITEFIESLFDHHYMKLYYKYNMISEFSSLYNKISTSGNCRLLTKDDVLKYKFIQIPFGRILFSVYCKLSYYAKKI